MGVCPQAPISFCRKARSGFGLRATYFLCEQKVGKESLRGSQAESSRQRAPALQACHPLRTPERATGASVGVLCSPSGGSIDGWTVPPAGSALVPPNLPGSTPPWGACTGAALGALALNGANGRQGKTHRPARRPDGCARWPKAAGWEGIARRWKRRTVLFLNAGNRKSHFS